MLPLPRPLLGAYPARETRPWEPGPAAFLGPDGGAEDNVDAVPDVAAVDVGAPNDKVPRPRLAPLPPRNVDITVAELNATTRH